MDTFAVVVQLYMSGFWAFGKWSDYTGLQKHGFAYATSTIGVPNGLVSRTPYCASLRHSLDTFGSVLMFEVRFVNGIACMRYRFH